MKEHRSLLFGILGKSLNTLIYILIIAVIKQLSSFNPIVFVRDL